MIGLGIVLDWVCLGWEIGRVVLLADRGFGALSKSPKTRTNPPVLLCNIARACDCA